MHCFKLDSNEQVNEKFDVKQIESDEFLWRRGK